MHFFEAVGSIAGLPDGTEIKEKMPDANGHMTAASGTLFIVVCLLQWIALQLL